MFSGLSQTVASKAKVFKSLVPGPSGLSFSVEQLAYFKSYGYIVIENLFSVEVVDEIQKRFPIMFDGQFETGIYPDEWYGRTGMCLPKMTKEICNGWKSDRIIAQLALSSSLHKITSQLHNWKSSRIAQDDVILKPCSGGTPVEFHRDGPYISDQFSPSHENSITVWIPLNDVGIETGTIEYVPGSHLWTDVSLDPNFHSSDSPSPLSHRLNFLRNLRRKGDFKSLPEIIFEYVDIPKGGVVFHHQNTFHGSGWNQSKGSDRCAMVVHTLRGDCQFAKNRDITYIYGRYQLHNEETGHALYDLNERFFPLCWSGSEVHQRSKWLQSYCSDNLRLSSTNNLKLISGI